MSGDLLTLRMMVVSGAEAVQQQWRQGATLASVPIEFSAAPAGDAIAPLTRHGCDIVIVDAATPPDDCRDLLDAARLLKPPPLIALAGVAADLDGADLRLPRADSTEEARAAVERCIRMRLPKRVLIVDDSRTMRGIVRKILSASRFALEVSEAEGGGVAVEKLAGGCDLVLLDCNMPGADGFEILAEIRKVAPSTAVVMMTSTDDEAMAGRAQASGADAFLKKPFYPADIDALLTRIYGTGDR